MRVWIDQDLCTGLALCERACPELFVMTRDGVAHVVGDDGSVVPRGQAAPIPSHLLESVIDAAEDCPEACIFIEA
jgi:ferredoxin